MFFECRARDTTGSATPVTAAVGGRLRQGDHHRRLGGIREGHVDTDTTGLVARTRIDRTDQRADMGRVLPGPRAALRFARDTISASPAWRPHGPKPRHVQPALGQRPIAAIAQAGVDGLARGAINDGARVARELPDPQHLAAGAQDGDEVGRAWPLPTIGRTRARSDVERHRPEAGGRAVTAGVPRGSRRIGGRIGGLSLARAGLRAIRRRRTADGGLLPRVGGGAAEPLVSRATSIARLARHHFGRTRAAQSRHHAAGISAVRRVDCGAAVGARVGGARIGPRPFGGSRRAPASNESAGKSRHRRREIPTAPHGAGGRSNKGAS